MALAAIPRHCQPRSRPQPTATFDNLAEDYFGTYVKLTRGYYEQFLAVDTVPNTVAELLAHVITSPPYINAQDYFRNFKLELHCLEGLLRFLIPAIKENFIGTERNRAIRNVPTAATNRNESLFDELPSFRRKHSREAAIVDRYLWDMSQSIQTISRSLALGGVFVLVCGDNLVAGHRIPTWRILNSITEDCGFVLQEQFGDRIECRHVPPKRNGHKGLIKQEVVSVFVKVAK